MKIDSLLQRVAISSIMLIILPLFGILLLAFGKLYPSTVIIKTELLWMYLPFFLFGVILFYCDKLLEQFSNYSLALSGTIMIVFGLLSYYINSYDALPWRVMHAYVFAVSMWFSASFCFHLFKQWANYPSALFRYLSEISYTVYLFHHILIIAIGILFINVGIGGAWGMLLQIIVATSIAIMIDKFLISKISLLSWLFNGKNRSI